MPIVIGMQPSAECPTSTDAAPLPPPAGEACARRPPLWQALGMLLLYMLLIPLLCGAALGALWSWLHAGAPGHGMTRSGVLPGIGLLSILVSCLATLYGIRRIWPRQWPLGSLDGFGLRRCPSRAVLQGALLGLLAQWLGVAAALWMDGAHPPRQDLMVVLLHWSGGALWMIVPAITLLIAGLVPCTEEVLFRGLLLCSASRRLRPWPAAVLVTLLFAAVHLIGVHGHLSVLFGIGALGAAAAWLRIRHHSLYPAMAAHIAFNSWAMLGVALHLLHAAA